MLKTKEISKEKLVEQLYINENGYSDFIKRYKLKKPLAWTSGDSPFRSDSSLCKKYKVFRFSCTLNYNNKSKHWDLTNEEKLQITNDHKSLSFEKKGTTVEYIRIYGFLNIKIKDEGIRSDIQKEMKNIICVHCCNSTTKGHCQADHKNSLKNDPRVLKKETQKKDDFQALCRSCNCLKRSAEKKTKMKGERFGATEYYYPIDFTVGDNILDENDPNWYIGTYWGDVVAFKQNLYLSINLNEQLSEDSENNLDNKSIEKVTNTINNLIL